MPDFSVHTKSEVAPWTCATCGTHEGPFLALNIDYMDAANVELCFPCCVLIGREAGTSDPGVAEELQVQVTELSQMVTVRDKELVEARDAVMKVVSLEDALAAFKAPKADVIPEPPKKAEPKAEPETRPMKTREETKETAKPAQTQTVPRPPARKQGSGQQQRSKKK